MTSITDLTSLRQHTLETFLVHGGKGKELAFATGPEAATFIRNPALLTHPLYSTSISNNYKAQVRLLESNLSDFYSRKLAPDSLSLAGVRAPGARENKYGASVISFDNEGALLAVGGSNGIVKVYDFDECYAATHISKSSDHSIKPVLAFDTRRDITSISWSHLRPDDIAVAFLFRPEIHIFDLGQIEEGNGPLGGAAEEPDKCLTVDGKGSSGHNIVLFWHDSKLQTQGNRVAVRTETEGVVAGSVSGYIRFWTTTLSNGASSNTKTCMWNLLADPHRSPLTACPVVSLLIVCSKNKSDSSGHSPLLLAATAQGVITLWDLSNMRPASFGSTAPEPSCVRRLEYTNHLMLFNSLTVVGATATEVSFCTFCKTKEDTRDHACNALQLEDRLLLFDTQDTAVQVLQNSKSTTGGTLHTYHATNNSSNSRNTKEVNHAAIGGSSHHLQQQKFHQQSASQESISTHLLLTLSSGDVAMVDLNTEKVVGCNKNRISSTTSAQYTLEGSSTAASTSSALAAASRKAAVSQNDPTRATVLSYEAIRRELSFQQEAAETGVAVTRNVLPAIIPAWSAAGHHCCKYSDYRNAEPLRAPAVVVALPDYETSGSALLTLSVQTEPAAEVVFPNAFNANGLCSVSGKDMDLTTGIVRSNQRRCLDYCTTLPGHLMYANPGSHEVTTSQDLQAYLCPEAAAQASYSKSHEVQFDWAPSPLFPTSETGADVTSSRLSNHTFSSKTASNGGSSNGSVNSGDIVVVTSEGVFYEETVSTNAIAGTSQHRIVLQKPYFGPRVVDGNPRVYLRTTLIPSGRTANSASVGAEDRQALAGVRLLSLRQSITAIAAHPTYPVLVAGTQTDDILVLNPIGKRHPRDDVSEEYSGVESLTCQFTETSRSSGTVTGQEGNRWWGRVLPIDEFSAAGSIASTTIVLDESGDVFLPQPQDALQGDGYGEGYLIADAGDGTEDDVYYFAEEKEGDEHGGRNGGEGGEVPRVMADVTACAAEQDIDADGKDEWTPQLPSDIIELDDSDSDGDRGGDACDGRNDAEFGDQDGASGIGETAMIAAAPAFNSTMSAKRGLDNLFHKEWRATREEPPVKAARSSVASLFAATRPGALPARGGGAKKFVSTTVAGTGSSSGTSGTSDTSGTSKSNSFPAFRNNNSQLRNVGAANKSVLFSATAPPPPQLLLKSNLLSSRVQKTGDWPTREVPTEAGTQHRTIVAKKEEIVPVAPNATAVVKGGSAPAKLKLKGNPISGGAVSDISRFFIVKK